MQKEWLHLVDAARRHKDEVEDRKYTQLEIEGAVAYVPEGEAAEKSCKDVQVDLVPNVILQSRKPDCCWKLVPFWQLDLQATATVVSSVGTSPS
jgi:hypothetical protein